MISIIGKNHYPIIFSSAFLRKIFFGIILLPDILVLTFLVEPSYHSLWENLYKVQESESIVFFQENGFRGYGPLGQNRDENRKKITNLKWSYIDCLCELYNHPLQLTEYSETYVWANRGVHDVYPYIPLFYRTSTKWQDHCILKRWLRSNLYRINCAYVKYRI